MPLLLAVAQLYGAFLLLMVSIHIILRLAGNGIGAKFRRHSLQSSVAQDRPLMTASFTVGVDYELPGSTGRYSMPGRTDRREVEGVRLWRLARGWKLPTAARVQKMAEKDTTQ